MHKTELAFSLISHKRAKVKFFSKKVLTNGFSFAIIVERFESGGRKEPVRSELLEKLFEKNRKKVLKKVLTNPESCGRMKVRHERGVDADRKSEWQRSLKIEQQMRKYKAQEVKRNT